MYVTRRTHLTRHPRDRHDLGYSRFSVFEPMEDIVPQLTLLFSYEDVVDS